MAQAMRNALAHCGLKNGGARNPQQGRQFMEANGITSINDLRELSVKDASIAIKAFNSMDSDHDRRISFEEFCHWWSQGYIERGRKAAPEGDDDSYHRFV